MIHDSALNPGEHLYVNNELFLIRHKQDLLDLIRDKMGEDAAEMVSSYLTAAQDPMCDDPDHPSCVGECIHTYRLQEHYERGIRDAVEDLNIYEKCTRKPKDGIQRIIAKLERL